MRSRCRRSSNEPWQPLQSGNDEVTQQAGLKLWQLVLWPVPVLTGAVVPWAWSFGPSTTPALSQCCFFISLMLAQSVMQLARHTEWTHSCCKALGPFPFASVRCHTLWPQSSQGIKDQVSYQTHSLTQLCKPFGLWCVAITPGLLKGQMPSDHSRALLLHALAIGDERWTKWTGRGQEKDHL